MTNEELYKEIIEKKCGCNICFELRHKVINEGIDILNHYEGFQCSTVTHWLMEYNNE